MRNHWIQAVCLSAISLTGAAAQEIDTLLSEENRHGRREFTVLDQVDSREEREAFERLSKTTAPPDRLRRAESFLARYPASWLLAHAYDVAAKAAIDTGNYTKALRYGKSSLQLLPENPLLLVPLSNLRAQEGLFDDAEQGARDALEYLDRFARPARYSKKEWAGIEQEARALAHFVLGRVSLLRGLKVPVSSRAGLLERAEREFQRSRALNPRDVLVSYLLGVTYQALGKPEEAGRLLVQVTRTPGPLASKATEQLRSLHVSTGSELAFGAYRRALLVQGPPEAKAPEPALPDPKPLRAEFAGSDSCEGCHAEEHWGWQHSGMAKMFRRYEPENIIGDFEDETEFPSEESPVAKMFLDKGKHRFSIRGEDGSWRTYPVDYTIGSKWQQAYATELEDGQIHVFPVQYSKLHGEWVNFWKVIDPPGSRRTVVEAFNELDPRTAYQVNCAPCHTSQLRSTRPDAQPQDLHFRETGINCEMCHGPSKQHVVDLQEGRRPVKDPMAPPVEFAKIDHVDYVEICGQCHMQSGVMSKGSRGEMNYSGHHNPFIKQYRSQPYPEFSNKAFYKDGRFKETTFVVESFLRSACYRVGKSDCGDCHNPHPADVRENPKSLKFRDNPDRMCLQCHEGMAADLATHTKHAAASEASRCASCHMPKIMNSLLFKAGTHRIDDIPNAEMTARFGQEHSPNACLTCHEERDTDWVKAELEAW